MNRHPAIVQLWHPQALSSSPPWIVRKCVKYALIAYMQSWLPTRCRTQHFKITVGIESVKIAEIIPILVFLIFPRPQLKDCPRLILSWAYFVQGFLCPFLTIHVQSWFRLLFSDLCVFFSNSNLPIFWYLFVSGIFVLVFSSDICLFQDHIQEVLNKWQSIDDEIWAKIIVLERNRWEWWWRWSGCLLWRSLWC